MLRSDVLDAHDLNRHLATSDLCRAIAR
jgi:hypothetical protein